MNSKWTLLMVFLVSGFLSLGGYSRTLWGQAEELVTLPCPFSDGDHPTHPERSIEMDIGFPTMPESVMVYEVVHPQIDEAWVSESGNRHFAMRSPVKRSEIGRYIQGENDYELEVDPTNSSFFVESQAFLADRFRSSGDFLPAEGCKTVALEFLQKHDLLPGDARLRSVVDNSSGADVISVSFGRRIGEYETWGAGARISVHIGRGGRIAMVFKAWQTLRPFREYPIMTPAEAFAELKMGKGVMYYGSKGKVKEIRLAYYCSPVRQSYVQPCYLFECTDDKGGTFIGLLPAVEAKYVSKEKTVGQGDCTMRGDCESSAK